MRQARIAAAFLGMGLAAGAVITATASVVDSSGVIHGCYSNQAIQGQHVLTLSDGACPSGATAIAWNQTGQQGPPSAIAVAQTLTSEFDVPCDGTWHSFANSALALTVPTTGATVLVSGYFQAGPVFDAASPGSSATPALGGRFALDGAPVSGSEVTVVGNGRGFLAFSHALSPGVGAHTFDLQIECPNSFNLYLGFQSPTLPVFARTLSVQDLG
jgi:hypothetical protein